MAYKRPGMAVYDVLAERNRQMTSEGYSEEHDDILTKGQLGDGAACYAMAAVANHQNHPESIMTKIRNMWPFEPEMFKPTDPRTDLIKAAAMIIAEIERMDRAAKKV